MRRFSPVPWVNQLSLSDLRKVFPIRGSTADATKNHRTASHRVTYYTKNVLYKLSKAPVVDTVSGTDKNRVGPSIRREETRLESLSDLSQEQDRREETQSVLLGHN